MMSRMITVYTVELRRLLISAGDKRHVDRIVKVNGITIDDVSHC